MSHTMAPDEIESQASGSRLRDANGNPLQAGKKYLVNRPGHWAKLAELFEDEVTGDLCLRIDVAGDRPTVQRVDDLAEDVILFLSSDRPGHSQGRLETKERIKELVDQLRDHTLSRKSMEAVDEISVLVDQL
jgi:hypothetical protein